MTTSTASWANRVEHWLDERGKGAWIALMILAFILFWPVGLAVLAYMIWSKRLFAGGCARHRQNAMHWHGGTRDFRTSGNSAFDAYKADVLDRLRREQAEFEAFLERLRASKDKSEFDQYMDERARAAKDTPAPEQGQDAARDQDTPRGSY